MKALLLFFWCLSTLFVNAEFLQKEIKGSGHVQTEERKSGNFHSISVSRGIQVFLSQGTSSAITVEADDNLLPYIKTEISGNQLKIYISKDVSCKSYTKMDVKVSVPEIKALHVTTSANIKGITPWKVKDLSLSSTTSGDIDMEVEAMTIEAKITTSGEITLKGAVQSLQASITTSGELEAKNLKAENADLKISTSGDAIVWVNKELSYSVTTSGDLKYFGKPRLQKTSVSTGGSVRNKN